MHDVPSPRKVVAALLHVLLESLPGPAGLAADAAAEAAGPADPLAVPRLRRGAPLSL